MAELKVECAPIPEQVAALFWDMASDEQADFFAALERMAGVKLCFQMTAVVDEIRQRAERGDHDAQNGFQTMLAHAQGYAESATNHRVWGAKAAIKRMAEAAMVPA